jgi:hypothetical protein
VRPEAAALVSRPRGDEISQFDELVFRWNNIPKETVATLYCPDWNADEILTLAEAKRGSSQLGKVDTHTISCKVGEITYVPVPGRLTQPMPALLTLQLPLTVRDGEQFRIDVQQHSGPTFLRTILERKPGDRRRATFEDFSVSARKVLGTFRVTVAVKIGRPLLEKLVRNLAVLRYILEAIPKADSWYPVFVRYIEQLGNQIKGLGVDPSQIPPSADDPGIPGEHVHRECYTGKVAEVIFDCFGDFEGFVLESCDQRHHFHTREKGIEKLVMQACRERLLLTVCLNRKHDEKIAEIVVRCC